jgi:N-acyl amino acid synthase of PEP-CTERM/exosortase system
MHTQALAIASSQERPTAMPWESFFQYFKPQLANNEQQKRDVYRLRHNVYCEELKFEEAKATLEERDEFDERSHHCFAEHLGTRKLAGTIRMVTSDADNQLLPIEQFCLHAITNPLVNPAQFARHEICEISRLAVPAQYRKLVTQAGLGGELTQPAVSEQERGCFTYISLCLYLAATAVAYKIKRHHVFVMMEPRLARSLVRVGIMFMQIGDAIEYHGQRAPFYLDARELRNTLRPEHLAFLHRVEQCMFDAVPEAPMVPVSSYHMGNARQLVMLQNTIIESILALASSPNIPSLIGSINLAGLPNEAKQIRDILTLSRNFEQLTDTGNVITQINKQSA